MQIAQSLRFLALSHTGRVSSSSSTIAGVRSISGQVQRQRFERKPGFTSSRNNVRSRSPRLTDFGPEDQSIPRYLRRQANGLKNNTGPYPKKFPKNPIGKGVGRDAHKHLLEPHVLSARLKKLCEGGKVEEAVSMLKNAPLDAQNTPVWNTMIWESMKAKRFKLSYELFTDMKRRGFSPTTRTFQTMFTGLSHIEDWSAHPKQLANARSLYEYFQRYTQSLKKEDNKSNELSVTPVASYIKILGDANATQEMFDVYYAMDKEGPLAPNEFVFSALFRALANRRAGPHEDEQVVSSKNASDAKYLWKQMLKASQQPSKFDIDAHIIAPAVRALSHGQSSDQEFAFEILRDFCGIARPNEASHSSGGKFLPLTVQTLAAALGLCNASKNHATCIHFFQQVLKRPENAGGSALLDRRHMEEVIRAHSFLSIPSNSLPSTSITTTGPQKALETLEWMLKQEITRPNGITLRPAVSTYNLVLLACQRGADWQSACKTFELMTGYHADDFADGVFEQCKNPRMERRTKGRNLIPGVETLTLLVRTAMATGEKAALRQVLRIVHYLEQMDISNERVETRKNTGPSVFYDSRLALTVSQAAAQVLSINAPDSADKQMWMALRRRVEEIPTKPPRKLRRQPSQR